jgi:hypothetical protein
MADPTYTEIGVFVAVAIALIPAIDTLRGWIKPNSGRTIENDPLNVAIQHPPVGPNHTHPENQLEARCNVMHQELNARFDNFASEVRASLADHDRKAEARTSDVHDRINNLVQSVSDKLTAIASATSNVQGKLDNHIANDARRNS